MRWKGYGYQDKSRDISTERKGARPVKLEGRWAEMHQELVQSSCQLYRCETALVVSVEICDRREQVRPQKACDHALSRE